jgi:type IV secretory pathway VirB10-like protein
MSRTADPSFASPWSNPRRPRRRRWLPVLLAVGALHLLLLGWMQGQLRQPLARPAPAQAPLVLVWIKPPEPAPEPKPSAPPPPRETPARRPARIAPAPSITAVPPLQAAAPASAASAPATTAAQAASAPGGGLLDTDASRRAIREAARQRSTGEMGAQATGEKAPLSEQERIGQEMARGARGDCIKGEYAGSGMGLLSLPFWLIAELREKCRR